MKQRNFILIILSVSFLYGCHFSQDQIPADKITSINIIDRNGMSETINTKERLNAFDQTDFLSPQPYQKVMRVYGKQPNGDVRSSITSYHPNGQVKQLLEAVNNRAHGMYKEWYPNGALKVEAHIIGGIADINTQAEQSWLFDGVNRAWDEDGRLIAEIPYEKGILQGDSLYFHSNGQLWKTCPYHKNQLHGNVKTFLEDGSLFQTLCYQEGQKDGSSIRFWEGASIAFQESYKKGFLIEARYYDREGNTVASIQNGKGFRAVFGKNELLELQEYTDGVQAGSVKLFDGQQHLAALYFMKNGEKSGEESHFYPRSKQPKLLLTWHDGVLQGPMKTWYANGQLESQREMSDNVKHGFLSAWYRNGSLMLVEEYDHDQLIKGEYYRMGERTPVSQIDKGKGIATLFNPEGHFSRKVPYQDGKPIE
jgi:antitoxin component YwqK of YwqJK toxin-antitoxin module